MAQMGRRWTNPKQYKPYKPYRQYKVLFFVTMILGLCFLPWFLLPYAALLPYTNERRLYLHTNLIGGIGNRMFIFQSSLGLSSHTKRSFIVSNSDISLLSEVFDLSLFSPHYTPFRWIFKLSTFDNLSEEFYNAYSNKLVEEILFSDNDVHLTNSYLQHPDYLKHVKKDLKNNAITLKWNFLPSIMDAARKTLYGHSRWVGVHLRRFPENHFVDPTPDVDLVRGAIKNALAPLLLEDEDVCVIVFSNDIEWARETLLKNGVYRCIKFSDESEKILGTDWSTNGGRDMASLTLCHSVVLTGGTFGYFAGLLHEGEGKVYLFEKSPFSGLPPVVDGDFDRATLNRGNASDWVLY